MSPCDKDKVKFDLRVASADLAHTSGLADREGHDSEFIREVRFACIRAMDRLENTLKLLERS